MTPGGIWEKGIWFHREKHRFKCTLIFSTLHVNRHNLGEIDREMWIDGYSGQIVGARRRERGDELQGEEGRKVSEGEEGGEKEGQEEINRFWKELKDTSPIQWFKGLARSQRGGVGATAGQKNMKWVQKSHTPPSFSELVPFPNNYSEGWSNSDAAVYRCRSTALTNNTYSTWWLRF